MYTRMDSQTKDHIGTKGPKQRNHPKQLLSYNLPTDKYMDLAKKLKKLFNLKMMVVPIVIFAFGTVTIKKKFLRTWKLLFARAMVLPN